MICHTRLRHEKKHSRGENTRYDKSFMLREVGQHERK